MYFNGVSLGLQPKGVRELITKNVDKWAFQGMEGHVLGYHSWMPGLEEMLSAESAKLVGARPIEVVCMNTLTVNCHLAMVSWNIDDHFITHWICRILGVFLPTHQRQIQDTIGERQLPVRLCKPCSAMYLIFSSS